MELSAYELAVIGGGFTVVGALIGAVIAYRLSTNLEALKEYRAACAKLRAAFSPALAAIYLARHGGTLGGIDHFISDPLFVHAAAIEEFRPFVSTCSSGAYQEAWESYRKTAAQNVSAESGEEWGANLRDGELLERKIYAIIAFAKT